MPQQQQKQQLTMENKNKNNNQPVPKLLPEKSQKCCSPDTKSKLHKGKTKQQSVQNKNTTKICAKE